jgi:sugar (pentulose or hexulose) kinase
MWAVNQADIRGDIRTVMTTGDYIAYALTGVKRLSASDAYCNGLLNKGDKKLAVDAIELCGLSPFWFPPVINSGHIVEKVSPVNHDEKGLHPWNHICCLLQG